MIAEKTIAILVAGGTSQRFGSALPKPYCRLGDETVLRRCVRAFLGHPAIDGVRVIIRREHHGLYKEAVSGLTLFPCAIGGETRQESVFRGLESLMHRPPKHVLVHDVARPLVSPALVDRVLAALESHQAAIPVIPVTDTIKQLDSGLVTATLPRESLVAVQTPQGFDYEALLAAHLRFRGAALSDDAALMERAGIQVYTVAGDAMNRKITTPEDWPMIDTKANYEYRTGMGFDVHALKLHDIETPPGKQHIKLCGVKVPSNHFLVGHSDADVGLHALVDAILGAIGAGDIGTHFPPDDLQWKGADSSRFLVHAYEMLKARGGEMVHLDLTLICEKPKIAPHREAMISHIAQTLKLAPDRISVKATTTEKLGFTGRGEGIAAQAVATVRLPIA